MSNSLNQHAARGIVHVDAGLYSLGHDTIPKAGPRHQTHVNEFWIDATAVSMAHVELFIASGAYFDSRWWGDSPRKGTDFLERGSVDKRCKRISELSTKIIMQINPRPRFSHEVPAVGITWMEAAAVCRFFGARLPFEAEWEVAMQTDLRRSSTVNRPDQQQLSRWGCELYLGFLEEWTAGAFTTRHWRGAASSEFASLDAPYGVCLRGSTRGSLFPHTAYRAPGDPLVAREFLGFRRVWCQTPTPAQLSLTFTGGPQ